MTPAATPTVLASPARGLLRVVGLAFGIAVVVGDTIGVGIMRTAGPTAGRLGQPVLIYLVWLGVGIFVLMVANTLEGAAEYAFLGPLEGAYRRVSRAELPRCLIEAVEERAQRLARG